jgi:UDP-N-acetylmuramoylalanine--D-glutamate ligase
VLLNLSQDHLERHPDMASYLAAKRRLFARQSEQDLAVLNADDPSSAATETRGRRLFFSAEGPADACLEGELIMLDGEALLDTKGMALVGRHNAANAMAAALAARAIGATMEAIAHVLRDFEGLAHRHRKVCVVDQVQWIDDSKATNVGATKAALTGYPASSVHLILGGLAKGQDFTVLRTEVERAVRTLYLIGEDGPLIEEALADAVPIERCGTLDEAVGRARAAATAGESVVLAPACASFDQFSSYAERGDRFAELARQGGAPCP